MRTLDLGPHQYLEISGEALRDAARTAVLVAREGAPPEPFDVAVRAHRGHRVLTAGEDERWIASGIADTYTHLNARPTTVAASRQWPPSTTPIVQPSAIEIRQAMSGDPDRYEISFLVTSDSAMRGRLFQETKATLTPESWSTFLRQQVLPCLEGLPRPMRVALAVGGTSADASLSIAASADSGAFDDLPEEGGEVGAPIRQRELEDQLGSLVEAELVGSSPGQPICSQVRIIRLVRHGGSLPIGLYVGLPTDRRVHVSFTTEGVDVRALP